MNLSKVRFVIESQSVNNKSMSLCISCNNKTYTFDKLEQINNIDIEVKFPSICKFETFGKDPKEYFNIPLAWFLGPMIITSLMSLFGLKLVMPRLVLSITLILLGLYIGNYIDKNLFYYIMKL